MSSDDMNLWIHCVTFLLTTGAVALMTWFICRRFMRGNAGAADDYFAGGRSLKWYVVAGSLMLTNLSTEQLVGLNGNVFLDGNLCGIWWEAGAALAMVCTSTVFLPKYMALGLTTTSSYLGERYDLFARTLVSVVFLVYYVVVLCPMVLYTGALAIRNIFDLDVPLWTVCLVIGLLGATYALVGGLKAVAVSDCINGVGLIIVGLWVPIAALSHIGGVSALFEEPAYLQTLTASSQLFDQTTQSRSWGVPSLPWHVTLTGLALNNLYYWSTNQVIVQRVLAARSLAEGQKGVLFAASMKVVGFTFLCLPGIIGILLVKKQAVINGTVFTVTKSDEIYPEIVKAVMPKWSLGFFAAVMIGSVLSTFNSALNSASTIFGLEVYKIYVNPQASEQRIVQLATAFGALMTLSSFFIAPQLGKVDAIFPLLQRMNTIVSLPIIVIFFVGIASNLPDAFASKVGFSTGLVACSLGQILTQAFPDASIFHYLHIYFASFLLAAGAMALTTYIPSLRSLLRLAAPTAYVTRHVELVDLRPWRARGCLIVAILANLTLLIISLQIGSSALLFVFWICWAMTILGLMAWPASNCDIQDLDLKAQKKTSAETSKGTPELIGVAV